MGHVSLVRQAALADVENLIIVSPIVGIGVKHTDPFQRMGVLATRTPERVERPQLAGSVIISHPHL